MTLMRGVSSASLPSASHEAPSGMAFGSFVTQHSQIEGTGCVGLSSIEGDEGISTRQYGRGDVQGIQRPHAR